MEIIRGKTTSCIDAATLNTALSQYRAVHLDIGTGDGCYVTHLAQQHPHTFVIGLDACRDSLHSTSTSRRAPANTLFVIANALDLPRISELHGTAAHLSINFPWGSLIRGLLNADPSLLDGLRMVAQPNAQLEVRLNGGALTEAGWSLEDGSRRVREVLRLYGFMLRAPRMMTAQDLRSCPTTWAKRLAFGRDPRAICLSTA